MRTLICTMSLLVAGVSSGWAAVPAEFMFHDSKKWADNGTGRGWARWVVTDLKPYGKDEFHPGIFTRPGRISSGRSHVFK